MASRELYSSIAKPKKKYTLGQRLGDAGLATARTTLSGIPGLDQIITDDMFTSEKMADVSGTISGILSPIKQAALSAATGGLGGVPAGPTSFAKGGLRTFEGNSHEEGGIPLGQDEAEDGETMMPMDSQSDFIFSDRLYPIKSISPKGKITFSKKSFAQLSKQINKPLELRPNDPYAKKTADIKLGKLAQEQEALKQSNDTEQFAMGGKRYDGGGLKSYASPIEKQSLTGNNLYGGIGETDIATLQSNNPWYNWEGFNPSNKENVRTFQQTFNRNVGSEALKPDGLFGKQTASAILRNEMNPIQLPPKGIVKDSYQISPREMPNSDAFKSNILNSSQESSNNNYQSNFLPTALGYAAQAATNIPALTMKPDTVNFSRVKFDDINLAEQRNEARRARNLGLATARGIGGNDTGQMMNYLSGTAAGLNSVYGNQFNQSLLQEQQANADTNMREQMVNSQIEMQEEGINTAEKDAIRNLKMNSLSQIGTIAAMSGKDYMAMNESDNMLNVLMGSNPDYTYEVLDKKGLFGQPRLKPIKRALGGKRRRAK